MLLRTIAFLFSLFLFLSSFSQPHDDCPRYQTFGDSSAASFLEFADRGYVTRIYFAKLAAQQTDSAAYQLLLPRFGESTRQLSELDVRLSYDDFWERWELSLPRRRVARIECASYPDAMRNFSGAVPDSISVRDDQLYVEYVGGNREAGSYFHFRLAIDEVAPMPTEAPQVTGTYLPDSATEAVPVAFAEATYLPGEQKLTVQYGTLDSYQNVPLYDVSPGPSRYEEVNDYFGEYTHRAYVIDTLQPGLLAMRVYDFSALKAQGEESDAGFFPEVEIEYPLSVGKLIADLRSTDVTWQPALPDLVFGQSTAAPPAPSAPDPVSEVDFDAAPLPDYQLIGPFDLTYFPTKGGQPGPVGIEERIQPFAGGDWSMALTVAEKQATSQSEDPRIAELEGILAVFKKLEKLRGPDNYEQVLRMVKQLNQTYALGMEDDYPEPTSLLREKLVEAVSAKYPQELIQQVYQGGQKAEGQDGLAKWLPITLTFDGETGLPMRTQMELLDTDITLRYQGESVEVVAQNDAQGRDSLSVPLPQGSIDLFQFRHQLSYLPLAEGYTATFPIFAVSVQRRTSYSGQAGRRETVTLEPVYLRAKATVQALERPKGATEDWYRVQVQWDAVPRMLPFFEGKAEGYGQPIEAIYWLTRTVPHRLRRVDYGRGRGLEGK